MAKVTGIGEVFFKSRNKGGELASWYQRNVIRFANVNSTGSASANAMLTKDVFRMGNLASRRSISFSSTLGAFNTALTLFLLLTISSLGLAQSPLGKKVDAAFASHLSEGIAGTLLVVEKDKVTLRKAYGYANNETKAHNRPETLFNVASIGKQFTVYSVLLLEQRGLLATTDLVSKHLPQFGESKATIHQLLSHTSGLVKESAALDYSTRAGFIDSLVKAGPESTPGEKYRYSNAGYSMLAAIVEMRAGKPFEIFIAENVFTPFGMRYTGYPWEQRINKKMLATGYNNKREPVAVQQDFWAARGPGNLVTNLDDLLKWMRALQNPKRVVPSIREKMLFDYLPGRDTYSWTRAKTKRGTRFFHKGGGRADFENRLMWFPDDGVLVLFMLNNDYNIARNLFKEISAILD